MKKTYEKPTLVKAGALARATAQGEEIILRRYPYSY